MIDDLNLAEEPKIKNKYEILNISFENAYGSRKVLGMRDIETKNK